MIRAEAAVDLTAVERNCACLRGALAPGAALCAVVKADGYGHGAAPVARAAQAGGAAWLAVSTAQEAAELRAAGVEGRVLVMGALSAEEIPTVLDAAADVVAWREAFVAALAAHGREGVGVHVKLDTGMGRLGTRDADEARAVAEAVLAAPGLELAGAMTHFATADADPEFMELQRDRFEPFAAEVRMMAPGAVAHAANSAATLRDPGTHFDLVRCGIAVYGMDPFGFDPEEQELEPALALRSYVADVKPIGPGESAGYGRTFVAEEPGWIAVVPIGYADGVRRLLSNRADVLVDGRRRRLAGTVSMDTVTVDLGPAPDVAVGAEVVLLGAQGGERILPEEWARHAETINYEITCGISDRVPRVHHSTGDAG